ncbi:MAG: helix-turn-helix domain-containing protein, partial [Candidatus Nomurabacteria bacterium]|nr:helix-turn-helix domain-containing protein [Candidatus Nomurabacteria bacterium]
MNELLKKQLKEIIDNKRTVTSLAKELNVSRHTIYKYLYRYKRLELNQSFSLKEKRNNTAHNKIPSEVESLVISHAKKYPNDSVLVISKRLEKESHIVINSVTVFRILKRNNIRYSALPVKEISKEKVSAPSFVKSIPQIKNIESVVEPVISIISPKEIPEIKDYLGNILKVEALAFDTPTVAKEVEEISVV